MSHFPLQSPQSVMITNTTVMITEELTSILEAPCRELKPAEPFPFKSNRISRGVRFQHFLILFPFYPEYKKLHHLYSFNLFTRKWGSVELRNSPEILENTDNYKVVPDDENGFLLVGCYKAFQANTTGNLFFQSQAMSLKKTLGYIKAKIDQGELVLQWENVEGAEQLPYLEKFSANVMKDRVYIFGGCDENGKAMNDLFLFNLQKKKVSKVDLLSRKWGDKDQIPCARMNHASLMRDMKLQIFGGEDNSSNALNDDWRLEVNFVTKDAICTKFTRQSTNRCPKLGTPCFRYGINHASLFYIGKSTTQTLPPFNNYLCAEKYNYKESKVFTYSQKDPLPFDGVPHTMEIFENMLILGFESSIYSISFNNEVSPAPDFEEVEDSNDGILTKKKTRPINFKGHMRQYFEEKPFPDVKFKVQGEEICAHKGIISVRCPFFSDLFCTKESEPVEINDLSPEGFNALLEWLYCNEILDLKDDIAAELLKVSKKYSLPKLKIEAEKCLLKNLAVENILERAKLAVEFNARDLETAAVNFIFKNLVEVKKKEEVKSFPSSIIDRVDKMHEPLNNFFKNMSEIKFS